MKNYIRRVFYSTSDLGKGFDRKIYLLNQKGEKASFWNDVPMRDSSQKSDIFNAVIEMPRYTIAKLELARHEPFHPLMHDRRQNLFNPKITELRSYAQYGFFNYGFIPQTWENMLLPNKKGDNDPLDLVEISDTAFAPGSIIPVKVFGVFALVDEGELDWKVIALNKEEAENKNICTLEDLEKVYPFRLQEIKRWFKYIKTFDRKAVNEIAFNEKIFDCEKTIEVIHENHEFWKQLREVSGNVKKYELEYGKKLLQIAKEFHMSD